MIRLTELEYGEDTIKIKLEGEFTEETLAVFAEALAGYERRGIKTVRVDAEGLMRIDSHALEAARPNFPTSLDLAFCVSRPTLRYLLKSCGLNAA